MNIYVGNLPFSLQETELKDVFTALGEVASVKIIVDKYSGRSRGYGFIEMPNEEQAVAAIEKLNGIEVGGRNIVVKKSEERKEGERREKPKGFRKKEYRGNYNNEQKREEE